MLSKVTQAEQGGDLILLLPLAALTILVVKTDDDNSSYYLSATTICGAKSFTCINQLNARGRHSVPLYEAHIIIPVFSRRENCGREVYLMTQGHTARKW